MRRATALLVFLIGLVLAASQSFSEPRILSRWSFDGADPCANSVPGGPACRVEKATPVEGKEGKGMKFEDWSTQNYLKPDASIATRLVFTPESSGSAPLAPAFPFRVSAWIFPTDDPVYYGGIVEKGRGYGGAYRLVLTRGLKVSASLGDRHVTARSQTPLTTGQWHEVAMEADGRNLVLIVDGKEAARAPIPDGLKMPADPPLVIGDRFTGRIDDVVISTP